MNSQETFTKLEDLYRQAQRAYHLEAFQGSIDFYAEDAMKAVTDMVDTLVPALLELSDEEMRAIYLETREEVYVEHGWDESEDPRDEGEDVA